MRGACGKWDTANGTRHAGDLFTIMFPNSSFAM
jgi:hypothetical protein